MTEEEISILEENGFRPPGDSGPLIISVDAHSTVDLLLKEAEIMKFKRQMEEAEGLYRAIVFNEPSSSKAQMYLALYLQFDVGKVDEAEGWFRYCTVFSRRGTKNI